MKKILKKQKDINEFIENVGKLDNILKIYNCISRLRVEVKNIYSVNKDNLKKIENVEEVYVKDNSIHLLFKEKLNTKFFKNFQLVTGYDEGIFEIEQTVTANKSKLQKVVEVFSGVASPLLFILGAYGILSVLQSLLSTQWVQGKEQTSLIGNVEFFNQIYLIVSILTKGMSLALTMAIPWAVFRYTKQNQVFGIAIGLVFVLSTQVGTISISDLNQLNLVENWSSLNVFEKLKYTWLYSEDGGLVLENGLHTASYTLNWFGDGTFAYKLSFEGNMIGVIFSSVCGVYVLKFADKIFTNKIVSGILYGPFVFLTLFLVAFLIISPITFIATDYISLGLNKGFANPYIKWIIWGTIGLFGPYILLFSLDSFILIIGFLQFYTPDTLGNKTGPLVAVILYMCLTTSVTTATLAFIYENRNVVELKNNAIELALIGYISGVATPHLYKINSKLPHTMYSACLGSFVATLICCGTGITGTWGAGSLLGILSIQSSSTMEGINTLGPNGMIWGLLACITTIVLTTFLTIFFGKLKRFKDITQQVIEKEWKQTQ